MIVGALTKPPRFLQVSEILTLHESAIEQYGGEQGIRDQGLLDSAVNMPRQAFSGEYAHAVPFGMAAAYAFHICKSHPFVDGNKRTSLGAMVTFLHLNGWELNIRDLDAAKQILACVAGTLEKDDLASWIAANAKARPSLELRDFFAAFTPELDFSFLEASTAGSEEELRASYEDAAKAMPVVRYLTQRSDELRSQGNEPGAMVFASRAQVLIAIYRIAEDMGYEW